jgi:hypothetical protein
MIDMTAVISGCLRSSCGKEVTALISGAAFRVPEFVLVRRLPQSAHFRKYDLNSSSLSFRVQTE